MDSLYGKQSQASGSSGMGESASLPQSHDADGLDHTDNRVGTSSRPRTKSHYPPATKPYVRATQPRPKLPRMPQPRRGRQKPDLDPVLEEEFEWEDLPPWDTREHASSDPVASFTSQWLSVVGNRAVRVVEPDRVDYLIAKYLSSIKDLIANSRTRKFLSEYNDARKAFRKGYRAASIRAASSHWKRCCDLAVFVVWRELATPAEKASYVGTAYQGYALALEATLSTRWQQRCAKHMQAYKCYMDAVSRHVPGGQELLRRAQIAKSQALQVEAFGRLRNRKNHDFSVPAQIFEQAAIEAEIADAIRPVRGDSHASYLRFWEATYKYRVAQVSNDVERARTNYEAALVHADQLGYPDGLFQLPGTWSSFEDFKLEAYLIEAHERLTEGPENLTEAADLLRQYCDIASGDAKVSSNKVKRIELRRSVLQGLAKLAQSGVSHAARDEVSRCRSLLAVPPLVGGASRRLFALLQHSNDDPSLLTTILPQVTSLLPLDAWAIAPPAVEIASQVPTWLRERLGVGEHAQDRGSIWGRAYARYTCEYLFGVYRDYLVYETGYSGPAPRMPDMRLATFGQLARALRGLDAALAWTNTSAEKLAELIFFCEQADVSGSTQDLLADLLAMAESTAPLLSPMPLTPLSKTNEDMWECRGYSGPRRVTLYCPDEELRIGETIYVKPRFRTKSHVEQKSATGPAGKGLHIYPAGHFAEPLPVRFFVEGDTDVAAVETILTGYDRDWRNLDLHVKSCDGADNVPQYMRYDSGPGLKLAMLDADRKGQSGKYWKPFWEDTCLVFILNRDLERDSFDAMAASLSSILGYTVFARDLRAIDRGLLGGRSNFEEALKERYGLTRLKGRNLGYQLGLNMLKLGVPGRLKEAVRCALLAAYGFRPQCANRDPRHTSCKAVQNTAANEVLPIVIASHPEDDYHRSAESLLYRCRSVGKVITLH
jgi:hypothetical protein